jgi:hypothetical protein
MECIRCKRSGELAVGECVAGCTFAMHEKCFKQFFKSHTASAHMKEKRMDYPCPVKGCNARLVTKVVLDMKRNVLQTSSYDDATQCSAVICFSCSLPVSKNEVQTECSMGHTYSAHANCVLGDKILCPSPGCSFYVRPKKLAMRAMRPDYGASTSTSASSRIKMFDRKGGCEFLYELENGETVQCCRVLNGSQAETSRRCLMHLSESKAKAVDPPVTTYVSKSKKKWRPLTLEEL